MSSSGARRLLLVSTNYAPEHAGIAPYATQIAEHWAAGGAEVHVLTGMPHYPAWRLDPAYAGVERVVEERAGVRVHRRGHVVPARQTALNRARFEASVLRGGRDEPEGMGRPDAVFAQMPSLAGGLLAARAAQRHGVPFIPVVQDLMGAAAAQSGIRGGGPAALVAGRVERHVLRQAALVGVIHESFTPKVEAMGVPGERVRVVPNWSHIRRPSRSREEMRARLGWRPGQVVLLHSGNMGLKQGLEVLVETARSAPELRVVLMGDGNQREHLRALAGGLPNLDFMPPAADEEFADVLAAADVLAVTQRASVRDMSLPSKLTSYFAAGRPVLGSVAPDSGTALEITRSGAGVNVPPESAPAILTALASLTADPDRMAALAAAGPAYAEAHLTPAAGLARIDALLTEALSLAPPPPPRPSAAPAVGAGSPEAAAERTGAEPSASREQTAAPARTLPPPPTAPAVPPKPSAAPDIGTAAGPDGEQPRDEDTGDGTDDPAAAPHTAADDEKDTPAGSGAAVPAGSGSQGGTGAAEAAAGEKEGLGG